MNTTLHKNIRVKGNVQGVGFRMSARQKAQELGVNGFVRNEPDGTVYIEAEAEPTVLKKFIAWCKGGPDPATVHHVKTQEGEIQEYKGFNIRYS